MSKKSAFLATGANGGDHATLPAGALLVRRRRHGPLDEGSPNQLRAEGNVVLDEDVARHSTLGSRHINMLGRYAFTIPDMVARGELRPLRDPSATGIDDA